MSQVPTPAAPTGIAPVTPSPAPAAPQNTPAPSPDGQKPRLYAGKYSSVEDLEKSYDELQKKLGSTKAAAAPSIAPIEPPAPDDEAGMADIISRAGLNLDELAARVREHGKPTDEQYAALKKVGVTRGMANEYLGMVKETVDARQWRVDRAISEAESVAGGKHELETLRQWAGAGGIDAARLNRLNAQLKNDPAFYPDYIRLVAQEHAKSVQAGGAKPLIGSGAPASTGGLPSDPKELRALVTAFNRGDPGAIGRVKSIPDDQWLTAISRLMNS